MARNLLIGDLQFVYSFALLAPKVELTEEWRICREHFTPNSGLQRNRREAESRPRRFQLRAQGTQTTDLVQVGPILPGRLILWTCRSTLRGALGLPAPKPRLGRSREPDVSVRRKETSRSGR